MLKLKRKLKKLKRDGLEIINNEQGRGISCEDNSAMYAETSPKSNKPLTYSETPSSRYA